MTQYSKRTKEEADNLQSFARRIENQIIKANMKGQETMERLICRLLTGRKTPQVAAAMAHKWVEWRYGKATENLHLTGSVIHEHVDASQLSDAQLAEAETLIESAYAGSDQG
jgi:hypothetical protein